MFYAEKNSNGYLFWCIRNSELYSQLAFNYYLHTTITNRMEHNFKANKKRWIWYIHSDICILKYFSRWINRFLENHLTISLILSANSSNLPDSAKSLVQTAYIRRKNYICRELYKQAEFQWFSSSSFYPCNLSRMARCIEWKMSWNPLLPCDFLMSLCMCATHFLSMTMTMNDT